jgi:hypothetical protein
LIAITAPRRILSTGRRMTFKWEDDADCVRTILSTAKAMYKSTWGGIAPLPPTWSKR